MHLIWHSRRGRRRNHLWQIVWWSVEGYGFCGGSKIAISHWLSQWPLTQGWRYRAACDKRCSKKWCCIVMTFTNKSRDKMQHNLHTHRVCYQLEPHPRRPVHDPWTQYQTTQLAHTPSVLPRHTECVTSWNLIQGVQFTTHEHHIRQHNWHTHRVCYQLEPHPRRPVHDP